MSLIHNERIKLTANWLDRAGTAALTVGVLAPLATALYGLSPLALPRSTLFLGIASWFVAGVGLHLAGRWLLKRLKP
ncbi:MAG TPA: hypothetical protein VKB16_09665 [Beijerinckiaceae bacterium]|jgi:uncharacterized membrane protein|nr:hypothetical protein [Beijerinckiaceae bacterium]